MLLGYQWVCSDLSIPLIMMHGHDVKMSHKEVRKPVFVAKVNDYSVLYGT